MVKFSSIGTELTVVGASVSGAEVVVVGTNDVVVVGGCISLAVVCGGADSLVGEASLMVVAADDADSLDSVVVVLGSLDSVVEGELGSLLSVVVELPSLLDSVDELSESPEVVLDGASVVVSDVSVGATVVVVVVVVVVLGFGFLVVLDVVL